MIDIVGVSHYFGLKPVLKDVSLRFEAGTLTSIMGPNGSGKTTLMQIMAGILSPIKGHVSVNGMRRREIPEEELNIRRQVVFLPAQPWIPLDRTISEWLVAVGKLYGVAELRLVEHVPKLLNLFDLEEHVDSPMRALSTGQQKKAALTAAIATEAPVLLLDEPFAGGLDPSAILALKQLLTHLRQKKNTTIVMATPVPELVEELSDRIAILMRGKIVAFDDMAGLRRQAGVDEPLDQVYERIVSPKSAEKMRAYFEGTL
jgi:ABC-2 type transport system ATP-binding protein